MSARLFLIFAIGGPNGIALFFGHSGNQGLFITNGNAKRAALDRLAGFGESQSIRNGKDAEIGGYFEDELQQHRNALSRAHQSASQPPEGSQQQQG